MVCKSVILETKSQQRYHEKEKWAIDQTVFIEEKAI
jgi:hypothetical protein